MTSYKILVSPREIPTNLEWSPIGTMAVLGITIALLVWRGEEGGERGGGQGGRGRSLNPQRPSTGFKLPPSVYGLGTNLASESPAESSFCGLPPPLLCKTRTY